MNIVTVRCEHKPAELKLEVAEKDIHYIQCQLLQITLTPEQARQVVAHCDCMAPAMWFDKDGKGGAAMTIDPSQLRLENDFVRIAPVG